MAWAPDYVEVETLAAYLRINDDLDDAELALAISAASRSIDQHTNRQFGQTGAEERFYTARRDYEFGYWVVDVDDFMVTGAPLVEVDGVAVTGFVKEPRNAPSEGRPWTRLRFTVDSEVYPCGAADEVSVVTGWGWADYPDTIEQATLLQSSRFFKRRESPFGVAGSPDMGNELRLLAKVDPDVAVMLRPYRRLRSPA